MTPGNKPTPGNKDVSSSVSINLNSKKEKSLSSTVSGNPNPKKEESIKLNKHSMSYDAMNISDHSESFPGHPGNFPESCINNNTYLGHPKKNAGDKACLSLGNQAYYAGLHTITSDCSIIYPQVPETAILAIKAITNGISDRKANTNWPITAGTKSGKIPLCTESTENSVAYSTNVPGLHTNLK